MSEKNIHYGKPRSGLSFSNPELQKTVKSDISDLAKLSEDKDKSKAAWKEILGMFYPMIIATVLTGMIVFITKI